MEMEKYELIEMVGVGSYGQVFKAKEKATGRNIAVKLIKKKQNASDSERKEQKKFLKECNIHSSLSHPNIIQMLGSFETIEYIVVVTELAGIDLHRFMSNHRLSDKHVQKLSGNLLSALYYLHSHRVSHRDLKPQNILLNNFEKIDDMEAKLCDFGLARKMTSETYLLTSVKGTPLYMAPEVMDEALYDERADLWSVGCIIYEAQFGKPPIKTQSFSQLLKWLRCPEITWPSAISDEAKSFLQGLLKKEPRMRLTWPQIVAHPYVKEHLVIFENNKLERPLTADLTMSQQIRKEKQRDEIIFNRGKKMIADAMLKCQQAKLKTNPKTHDVAQFVTKKKTNVIGDNESISSDDSINAIVQTDLETDVEGDMIKKEKKTPASNPYADGLNPNLVLVGNEKKLPLEAAPVMHIEGLSPNMVLVGGGENIQNANHQIGTMMEHFEKMQLEEENKWCAAKAKVMNPPAMTVALVHAPPEADQKPVASIDKNPIIAQAKSNSDLVKRKLSQNLENFSIRLGNDSTNNDKKCDENKKDNSKEKTETAAPAKPAAEKSSTDAEVKPYEEEQSPPIENEEWLAFIHMSMQEVLNGETDSLKHPNLVGIIVAILRNFNASTTVIKGVIELLSIPFVLPLSNEDITLIKSVYAQTKLLPNTIFASKIICMVKGNNLSISSTLSSANFAAIGTNQEGIVFKKMSDLEPDQVKTLGSVFELVCYLIHQNESFLAQFCDSVYIIASDLLRHLLSDVVYDSNGMQIVCAIISTLCFVLRETPENGEIIESIIFHDSVDVINLLNNGNVVLKSRICYLLRIVGRFSCVALQAAWTAEFKQTLEGLMDDGNAKVKDAARDTIEELRKLSFYNV